MSLSIPYLMLNLARNSTHSFFFVRTNNHESTSTCSTDYNSHYLPSSRVLTLVCCCSSSTKNHILNYLKHISNSIHRLLHITIHTLGTALRAPRAKTIMYIPLSAVSRVSGNTACKLEKFRYNFLFFSNILWQFAVRISLPPSIVPGTASSLNKYFPCAWVLS